MPCAPRWRSDPAPRRGRRKSSRLDVTPPSRRRAPTYASRDVSWTPPDRFSAASPLAAPDGPPDAHRATVVAAKARSGGVLLAEISLPPDPCLQILPVEASRPNLTNRALSAGALTG